MPTEPNEPVQESRERGLRALQRRAYGEAVILLSRYVEANPGDDEAVLELALAELVIGERMRFLDRYNQLVQRLRGQRPATPRAESLLSRCRRVGESMAAAAAMLAAAGIPATAAGCAKKPPPDPGPAATLEVPAASVPEPEPGVSAPPSSVSSAAGSAEVEVQPSAGAKPPLPPATTRPRPKTRYIAVRRDPVPNLKP